MVTVLITGAGGAAVPDLIMRLRDEGYRVIAADMDEHAAGFYLADSSFVIPAGKSSKFIPAIRQICSSEKVDIVVPLVDEELLSTLDLEGEGVVVLLPRRDFVDACLDKYKLMGRLKSAGIPVPETRLADSDSNGMRFPIVIKPRVGRGSNGVRIAKSKDELDSHIAGSAYTPDELLMQSYIEGVEYTVSVVAWRDGEVQAVVPKQIICKKGITRLAVSRRDDRIDSLCRKIQKCLKADGPFNVQLRIDQETGEPLTFEINPRFSTTISLTNATGVDELGGLIAQAIGGREKYHFGAWKEGVVLMRRTLDEFTNEATVQQCEIKEATGLKK